MQILDVKYQVVTENSVYIIIIDIIDYFVTSKYKQIKPVNAYFRNPKLSLANHKR